MKSILALTSVSALCLFSSPVAACGWDDEVYLAEAKTLPCLASAIDGTFPRHGTRYYETRLRAAQAALLVDPYNLWALDMASVATLKLRRYADAEKWMQKREAIALEAYASHANLGTLYTFTGAFDKALEHIDIAMKKEPSAHFGREKYHRLLVVFLMAQKEGKGIKDANFLGVAISDDERTHGSPAKFDARLGSAGLGRDVFDALDSMVTVYGAEDNPHVFAAIGDMLALFGAMGQASMAYTRAAELKHPAAAEMKRRATMMFNLILKKSKNAPDEVPHSPTEMLWIPKHPEANPGEPEVAKKYSAFEETQLKKGLAVWTQAGLRTLYAEQERLGVRCQVTRTFPGLGPDVLVQDGGAK